MASRSTRVALYGRVSTRDHDQNPETQLLVLREFAADSGWQADEFVDYASGKDLNRPEWLRMMKLVRRGRYKVIIVVAIDRAFRSVLDGSLALSELDALGCRFIPLRERAFDTCSPIGKALLNVSLVWAELERELTRERIRAGLKRARAEGKHIGRPKIRLSTKRAVAVLADHDGDETVAAEVLNVSRSTLRRRLAAA